MITNIEDRCAVFAIVGELQGLAVGLDFYNGEPVTRLQNALENCACRLLELVNFDKLQEEKS